MVEKQDVVDFLKDLAGSGGVEINVNANTLTKLSVAWGTPQIYFCAWFRKGLKERCGDWDFTCKKYIPVDIDIRLAYYESSGWTVLSHEEMMVVINDLLDKIDNTTDFSTYSYAVCSGNGLHLYYVGDEIEISRDDYSRGVEYMQGLLDNIITPYKCDSAVKNIARIMRVPGTINPRKKVHGDKVLWNLWDYVCDFLRYRPGTYSHIVWALPILAEEQKKLQEVKTIVRTHKSDSDWSDFDSVDVWELACLAWGVTLWRENWDIIPLKEPHKNMGAYIYKPYNVVVNTWSSLIRDKDRKTFSPFDIVCYEMMGGDKKKTLDYFKEHYHVEPKKKIQHRWEPSVIDIPKMDYDSSKGFFYPAPVFDDVFRCFMAGELVTICAESNSWKTTFALDILTRNKNLSGRKGFYVNLEFDIRNVWRQRRLSSHWFDKLNLTDIAPLSAEDKASMDSFVDWELSKFDTFNEPTWIELEALVDLLLGKVKEGYELVVIDTLWDIHWFSGVNSWSNQNRTMQTLQALAHNTWLAIVLLHHKNKKGDFSGSNKIKDFSNVFIEVESDVDADFEQYTTYSLTKDKFLWNDCKVCTYYHWGAYDKYQ